MIHLMLGFLHCNPLTVIFHFLRHKGGENPMHLQLVLRTLLKGRKAPEHAETCERGLLGGTDGLHTKYLQ